MAYKPPFQSVLNGRPAEVPSSDAVFDYVASAIGAIPAGANVTLSNLTAPTAVSAALLGQDGTVSDPAFSFISDPDTGVYRSAANTLAIACTGVQAATLTRNVLSYGDNGVGGNAILNLRGGPNYGMIQKDGAVIMQFVVSRMEIAAMPWYLITANTLSNFGYQTGNANQNNTQSFYIGGFQKRLIAGPNRTTSLGNGGVVSATSRPYETLSSNITANNTNVLVVNTIGGGDESIRDRGRTSMGIGEKIAITRIAQPTLIAKILSATIPNPATWWIANYTLDISVPAAYTGGTVESRPTLFIASNSSGVETFSIDYDGAVNLDGVLVVNESGADKDTRIEGDTDANLLFVDASTDRVGIGTATPSEKLEVVGAVKANEFVVTNYRLDPHTHDEGTETGNFTINWSNGAVHTVTLNAAGPLVITMTNPVNGGAYALRIIQGATPGTVTWPLNVKWPGGTPPTLSTTTGDVDIINFLYFDDGGGNTYYYGTFAGDFS